LRLELTLTTALALALAAPLPAFAEGPVEGSIRIGQHDDVTRVVIETKGPVTFSEDAGGDGRRIGVTASAPVELAIPKHVNPPLNAVDKQGPTSLSLDFKEPMRVQHAFQYPPQESYGYRMVLDFVKAPAGSTVAAAEPAPKVVEAPPKAIEAPPKTDWKPVATPTETPKSAPPVEKPIQTVQANAPPPTPKPDTVTASNPPPKSVPTPPPPPQNQVAAIPPGSTTAPGGTKPPIERLPGVETVVVPTENTFYPNNKALPPVSKPPQGQAPVVIDTGTAAAIPPRPVPSANLNGPPTGRSEVLPGFHAARFGALQDEVMRSLTADFGQTMSTLTMTANPTTPDRGIVIGVTARLPGSGSANISYAFEQQTRTLVRIDLEWGREHQGGLAQQEADAIATPLEHQLRASGFTPVKSQPDPSPGGKIVFFGSDPAGHLALLSVDPIGTVPPKGPPPRQIVRLSLVDVRQPERLKAY
jgi:hypothetical protein